MIIRISSRPPVLSPEHQLLISALKAHPQAHTAHIDTQTDTPHVTLSTDHEQILLPTAFTYKEQQIPIKWKFTEQPKPLLLPNPPIEPQTETTKCYNAPIPLGCQIQPFQKNWVGTAGSPIKYISPDGKPKWGLLTNAHVSGIPKSRAESQLHQPTDARPPIAHTEIIACPSPSQTNDLDCALADAQIDNHHKIKWEIIGIGKPNPKWTSATINTKCIKTGRTTGTTTGRITATGVAARINYGTFTALLIDLDQISPDSQQFSAPGDSGSLILERETKKPISLLFAGSSTTTLAIPIRNIARKIKIFFDP